MGEIMYFGEKIKLRTYKESDIEDSYALIENIEIKSMLGRDVIFPYSLDEQKEFVKNSTNKPCYDFAIELLETGEYIGGCGINECNTTSQVATIGIWLGIDYQGKGLGQDALKTLCRFIFDEMNIRKIKLTYFAFNQKGLKCYKKLGFKEEGILRKELFRFGEFHDIYIMGMFRNEFKQQHKEELS